MITGSTRKKPVCQKCGHLMAGHKRPNGAPVCPRDDSAPASPQRAGAAPPPFDFNPSASGYWERKNPNWTDPASYAKQSRSHVVPERGSSWVSTERDGDSQGSPSRERPFKSLPPVREVIDVDADDDDEIEEVEHRSTWSQGPDHEYDQEYEPSVPTEEGDDSDTSSNRSSATVIKRVTRRLSSVLRRGTPLASLYSSPRSQVPVITSAARAEGLYTRIVHLDRGPAEVPGFKEEFATPVRTFPGREDSWRIAVGRDEGAVNALVEFATTPPRPALRPQPDGMLEPYDYDRGLDRQRNERVGSYPQDPRWIRNTFFDILVAGAVGGLVVFYCLSAI